jgi:Tfp pilus assembly protein PilN
MIRINLLPRRHRKAVLPESGILAVALLVVGALVMSYLWEVWRNNQVIAQTAAINGKLVVVRRQVAEVLALEAKIEDLKAREHLLQSLEAREVPWSDMLVDLAGRTPRDAWLASAAIAPGQGGLTLNLNGSALSYNAVARFMTTLTGSPFYSDADLSTAQRTLAGTTTIVQFGLTLKMRPLPAPEPPAPPKSAPLSRAPIQEPSR